MVQNILKAGFPYVAYGFCNPHTGLDIADGGDGAGKLVPHTLVAHERRLGIPFNAVAFPVNGTYFLEHHFEFQG